MKNLIAAWMLCAASAFAQTNNPSSDIPIDPIQPVPYLGWTNTYRLVNDSLQVTIVPEIGRIIEVKYKNGENLFRYEEGLKNNPEASGWKNWGGDWLWPAAQSRWADFQGKEWPPSELLDGRAWKGRAWKNADGKQCCFISITYGEPLNLEVTRTIKLDTSTASFAIKQTMNRTKPSDVPVCLWNISQIKQASQVVIPTDPNSKFDGGFIPMMFDRPGDQQMTLCEEALVYNVSAGGEHKLCTDSERAWIAAVKNDAVIIERVTGRDINAPQPDGGCTIEMYSHAGLGYSEIETLSQELVLKKDESIENTLHVEVYDLPADLDPCALAAHLQHLLGEIK